MKENIHPNYQKVKFTCHCKNVFEIRSTLGSDLRIDVCSACSPFSTGGAKKLVGTGQVDKFAKRYGQLPKFEDKEAKK